MVTVATTEQAHAWELRGAWALGREIIVVLPWGSVRGYVVRVAPSGAAAWIDDDAAEPLHVPCADILALRRPHFHEGDAPGRGPRPRRDVRVPGQLLLFAEGGDADA